MRKLLLIGIGAGNPDHVTVQAIKALNEVDVFFVMDKGPDLEELARLRRQICERYIEEPSYRVVDIPDPVRDRTTPSYRPAVDEWRQQRVELTEQALRDELGDDESGGFLIWGDPSLYDGALNVVQAIVERGAVPLAYEVVPGISSVQALAARHRIGLNRVGGPVQITTGRLLAGGFPEESDDVVVMLDRAGAFATLPPDDLEIFWGAYLGTEHELAVSGPLAEVAAEIDALRTGARAHHGWIMDTYLLRRTRRRT